MDTNTATQTRTDDLIGRFSSRRFKSWYDERQFRQNIEEGQPYFNGPSRVPGPEQHSPSKLLQCHRRVYYQQANAPAEQPIPEGVFWFGNRFEEEVALPFLARAVTGSDTYIQNSVWVDFTVETGAGKLRIRGETDPVIVDGEARPILPTEIKTKSSVGNLSKPNQHHLAQLHAYLFGLSEKFGNELSKGILMYGSRKSLETKFFQVEFDEEFWKTTVLEWAKEHTEYRLDNILPPAEPEYEWECNFCEYRERCGQASTSFADEVVSGFLPLTKYPKDRVSEYLDAHPDAKLTPTLGTLYPSLCDAEGVYPWICPVCSGSYPMEEIEWSGVVSRPPSCPNCSTDGIDAYLAGPKPAAQSGREWAVIE